MKASDGLGQDAETPWQIPARGWLQIGKRVLQQVSGDNVQIVSAGVAFYFFLSLFPAVAACLSIYGLVYTPGETATQMEQLRTLMPGEAVDLISEFATQLSLGESRSLSWGVALSIVFGVWSTNKGTTALFTGLNIAYEQAESRPFLRRTLLTLGVTLGSIVVMALLLVVVAILPAIRAAIELPPFSDALINFARWPVIAVVALFVLGVLYKIAPNRRSPSWRWVTPGSLVATLLWLLGSLGFGWYIESFGNMSKTYGGVAAIVVLMLWFFITAFAILLGAEINAESEHQTTRDSTIGPERPLGQRGAWHADHVAGAPDEDGGHGSSG